MKYLTIFVRFQFQIISISQYRIKLSITLENLTQEKIWML